MNTVTVRGLTRDACSIAMTYFYIDELKKKGFIEGGCCELSADGRTVCDELRAAGFEFNPGELEDCAIFLMRGGDAEAARRRA